MTETNVLPWIVVNDMMDDDYRQQVVVDALSYYPKASSELNKFALDILKKTIHVNGFRSFQSIPPKIAKIHVIKEFKINAQLATAIICLWAEKQHEIIETLKNAARDANIPVHKKWGWHEARQGFVQGEDIPELDQLANTLAAQKTKPESDHYLLASLWLSSGLFMTETDEKDLAEPDEHQKQTIQPGKNYAPVEINHKNEVTANPLAATAPQDIPSVQPILDIPELDRKSIKELSRFWETQSAEIIGARDSALSKVDELKSSAIKSDPSVMREQMKQLDVKVKEWEALEEKSKQLVSYISSRLARELQLRPDVKLIQPEVAVLSETPTEDELVAILPSVFQAIENYDAKKGKLLSEIENHRNELLSLEQSLPLWQNDVEPVQRQLQQLKDDQDFTVQHLQTVLEGAKKVALDGKDHRLKSRQISISRILEAAGKLANISRTQKPQTMGQGLKEWSETNLQNMPDRQLQDTEKEVLAALNQLILQKETGDSQKLAAKLRTEWNNEIFHQLLQNLTAENRNLEAVLVEMASSAVYPREARLVYSREVAKALFNGVSELSADTDPYCLLNQLASCFFLGWTSDDQTIRYERCILALAAFASRECGLPQGLLWQIEADWPEATMKNWDQLWASALLEEEIQIYTDQKTVEMQTSLDAKQKEIEILLAKDGGHYMRLASIKSDRHRSMMTNHIMPQFVSHYSSLTRLRKQFETSPIEKHVKLLVELRQTADALEKSLTAKKLEELYEKGIYQDSIDDATPFHIKVCMRIMSEMSNEILEYAGILLNLETVRTARKDWISYQNLLDELNRKSETGIIIQHALEQIAKGSLKAATERDEEAETVWGTQVIVKQLLSDRSYIHRVPRTISLLINEAFAWKPFLQSLLADIETPQDILSAVRILLDNNATAQVLQVVQQLPLEVQKQAQAMHREQEKRVNDRENEFNKLGGESEWAKPDQDLGRWNYVFSRLSEEIAKLRQKTEDEHHRFETQSFAIREQINRLDINIFKMRSAIPVRIFGILQNGLGIARKASEVSRLFTQLKDYLDEVEYRLNRESWLEAELENATQELEKQLLGTRDEESISLDAGQILERFNSGELVKLGLDPDQFEDSKITTRVNILDNWLAIKNLRSVLSGKLGRAEINKIKSLFSYFARMHQMHHSRGVDNNYMSYENPIVHEYWELRFPRTPALAKQCVMVALPGNPPGADDLQSMDEFLEKEDFLATHFVFMFVPGCNNKIAKRLSQNYSKQGLVLIDESALIKMILAERENLMVPLGKLRPLMLNATGANADIFTVNQSVNSHTSIFFGRDSLIERIASSGDNYAIYGGRRIGKSSVLKALEQLLDVRNRRVVSYSLEGDIEYSEHYISKRLASLIGIQREYEQTKDFKNALFSYFDSHPGESIVLILDEIDRYISENRNRHTLIEALRATSDRFEHRFRVIIAGFMELYDCISGRGPYTPTSDPWGRMLNNMGPLENLKPSDAEKIVQEGFLSILGWSFEHRAIPRRIVERTGGHPAFVQYFCLKLQEQVSRRGDQTVTLKDIDTVFDDNTPEKSFIWFVRKTLEMNLSDPAYKQKGSGDNISDPVSRYLLVWLALDSETKPAQTFTLQQIREIANSSKIHIPEKILSRSLELLTVTSVVREKSSQLYEFTVPDYPLILNRLGEGARIEALEAELEAFLKGKQS